MQRVTLSFYDPPQDSQSEEDTDDDRRDFDDSSQDTHFGWVEEYYYQWRGSDGIKPIHDASKGGDLQGMNRLVAIGADVSARDVEKKTPLHYACEGGHVDVVDFLISNGAKVGVKDRDGKQPIHEACEKGHLQIVKTLLSKGADVDAKTAEHTPLHFASEAGHIEIVKLLLSYGANVNEGGTGRCFPLHHACKGGHHDIAKILLSEGASTSEKGCMGKRPFHVACAYGHVRIAELLLSHGANVDEWTDQGYTALHFACENGHLDVAKLLISYGANLENRKRHSKKPLHIASSHSHAELVNLLLAHGARMNDVDADSRTPLHHVCMSRLEKKRISRANSLQDRDRESKVLLQKEDDVTDREIALMLMVHGARVNCHDASNKTPLYYACERNDLKLVKTLLAHGAVFGDEECADDPLTRACAGGSSDIVEALLTGCHGVTDKRVTEALFVACKSDHPNVVKVLLDHGARVDTPDPYGRPPLRHAKSADVTRLLLLHGADISTPHLNCTGLESVPPGVLGVLLDHGAWLGLPCGKYKCRCGTTEMICRYRRSHLSSNYNDLEVFSRFFAKLEVVGVPHLRPSNSQSDYQEATQTDYQAAASELKAAKSDTAPNSTATYYDVLRRNASALQDQSVANNFDADECLRKYPTLGDMIICSYIKLRRARMEELSTLFFTLTSPRLPPECAGAVIKYLSSDDLKSVLRASGFE